MQRKKGGTQSLKMGEGERSLCPWWDRVGWDSVVLEKKGPTFLKGRTDKEVVQVVARLLSLSRCLPLLLIVAV